jgi:hypothetical protein
MSHRFDLAILSQRSSMQVSPQGVHALIRYLAAQGYITDVLRSESDDWVEIHAAPGSFAHALFHDGPATEVSPAFFEMGFRFGPSPLVVGYGPSATVHFFLEFRGAAFEHVTDALLERVDAILYARPVLAVRPHTRIRERSEGPPNPPKAPTESEQGFPVGIRVEER